MSARAIFQLRSGFCYELARTVCLRPAPWVACNGLFGATIRYTLVLAAAVICFTLATRGQAEAGGRVALLMGAEKYEHFKASKLGIGQITALSLALKKQGFEVDLVSDPGNAVARAAITDFARKADNAEFALIVVTGHFATYRRQSFFLPTNTRIKRATDLFSRGLSVKNISDIANRAKAGALLMMMSVPDISSTIDGLSERPDFAAPPPEHVVAVFSSSTKVPLSRVDGVSSQAMKDLIEAAGERPMKLSALVDAASAGATGRIFGKVTDRDLSKDLDKPAVAAKVTDPGVTEAEREARERAEARLTEAEERARMAEKRAKETEQRAKRELEAAAKAQAAAVVAPVKPAAPPPVVPAAVPGTNIESLQVVEALLGRGQRRVIQQLLRDRGLYKGSVDAIFGDLTRQAIKDFQKQLAADETGYLTPTQFQKLVSRQ